jgi:hypothetical protein
LLLAPFGTWGERRLIELNDPAAYDAAMPKMEGVLKRNFLGTPAGTWLDFQPQLSRISFVGNASTTPGVPGEQLRLQRSSLLCMHGTGFCCFGVQLMLCLVLLLAVLKYCAANATSIPSGKACDLATVHSTR